MTLLATAVVISLAPTSVASAEVGDITTIVGNSYGDTGLATQAYLGSPWGVALDSSGNIYVSDIGLHRVRRIDAETGIITTLAGQDYFFGGGADGGDGEAAADAYLHTPSGLTVDAVGNVYIADSGNHRVRRIDAATGIITSVAGNGTNNDLGFGGGGFSGDGGPATDAQLDSPEAATLDAAGNLYIADTGNDRIRKVDATTGTITTIAGTGTYGYSGDGGPASNARLRSPQNVAIDAAGRLYITDSGNNRIRRIDTSGTITTVVGTGTAGDSGDGGPATAAKLNGPRRVIVDAAGNLYITDTGNNRIRRVDATTGTITTIAGTGASGYSGDGAPATTAELAIPVGVSSDAAGNLYIADSGNYRIRKVDASTGTITTIAGNPGGLYFSGDGGPASGATLNSPYASTFDGQGNLYISDTGNNRVRRVDATTGTITTIAGTGSTSYNGDNLPATDADLNYPTGLVIDMAGNLYIADTNNHRVRRVDATTGTITTIAGTGDYAFGGDNGPATDADLNYPTGLVIDTAGNLYIADTYNHRIRRVDATTGTITTIAGTGDYAYGGDNGPASDADLAAPGGLALDPGGNLYIADTYNYRIRKVDATTGTITTIAGGGFGGDGGPAIDSSLNTPYAVTLDSAGNLVIADTVNNRIRKVTLSASAVPSAPAKPSVVAGNASIAVTWSAPAANGSPITGYTATATPGGATCSTTGALTCTITGLTNGTAHTVTVSATNAVGTSSASPASDPATPTAPTPPTPPAGGGLVAQSPSRLFDTRPGEPYGAITVAKQAVTGGTILEVQMTGNAGMPATGVGSVALNVTVDQPTANGYLTVYPCGTRPLASNLNYTAGQTIANTVITPVDTNGKVCFYAHGTTHLIADLTGWFPTGQGTTSTGPNRLFDTRPGEPAGD